MIEDNGFVFAPVTGARVGTRDGLTSVDEIDESRSRLPSPTDFVAIDGGNHAQFGGYGDNPATVSADGRTRLWCQGLLEAVGLLVLVSVFDGVM